MESSPFGKRVTFQKQDHLLVSHKLYSDGKKLVRLVIDTQEMVYKLVDPVTGHVLETGGQGLTNLEVLQRHAKRGLKNYLNIKFDKEVRNVSNRSE
jgi:hypothetical protein